MGLLAELKATHPVCDFSGLGAAPSPVPLKPGKDEILSVLSSQALTCTFWTISAGCMFNRKEAHAEEFWFLLCTRPSRPVSL